MRCLEFENRMHDLLDQRISPTSDTALRRHAASCESCRGQLWAQGVLFEQVGKSTLNYRDSQFVECVRKKPTPTRANPRFNQLVVSAVVACATLGLFAALPIWYVGHRHDDPTTIASGTPPYGTREARQLPDSHGEAKVQRSGEDANNQEKDPSPVHVAVPEAEQQLLLKRLTMLTYGLAISDRASHGELLSGGSSHDVTWIAQFTGSIKPITDSMASALHVIRKTIDGHGRSDSENSAFDQRTRTNATRLG